ncbi:MAG: beta-propeller domain-containing protein [Halorientalis sp.]
MGRDQTVLLGAVVLLAGVALGVGTGAVLDGGVAAPAADDGGHRDHTRSLLDADDTSLAQFESEAAFAAYVSAGRRVRGAGGFQAGRPRVDVVQEAPVALPGGEGSAVARATPTDSAGGAAPDRVADTNVQVAGVDEPDLVKTARRHLYYSIPGQRVVRPGGPEPVAPPRRVGDGGTHVLSMATPSDPRRVAGIDASGQLLRAGDHLVVLGDERLVGYDVSDPAAPEQVWHHELDSEVVTARLLNGTVYLVTRDGVSLSAPCPVEPLGGAASIPCTDVYRPDRQVAVDATYSALELDPASGTVTATASFVGTSDTTAVYVSREALYVTYTERVQRARLRLSFLLEETSGRLPAAVEHRLRRLQGYNLSAAATRVETEQILRDWYRTLAEDRRERVRASLRNDYREFLGDHQRALARTGVVRVGIDDLTVDAVGTVPGRPLNQFSLSQHAGTLRVATTVPAAGDAESVNDLYTLDAETLERRGSVRDMGRGQRVYAVRYAGDTAYVVTYRRVDPLHVVDLSTPSDPREVGRLRLPGFSTYLHPIGDDRLLGIGEEDGRVKAVLFDVSDPSAPAVADDFVFDARFSAVAESHHAFLLDREHGVFFLPTNRGGRVVNYTGGDLSLTASVATGPRARRARYVGDFLYVFAGREVVVVDERTWNRTATVSLPAE